MQSFNQKEYEKAHELNIILIKPAPQYLYCVKCRRKVFTRVSSYKKLSNGRYAVVSVHHACGTLMYRFTGLVETDTKDVIL